MRNLKKILALVLALVMVVGMMTVATAATPGTGYADDAAIVNYDEAIQVLSALGVYRGDEKGNFNPESTITRGEFAAIVYRIVHDDVNDKYTGIYSDYNKFSDVKASDWNAGYINYCANGEFILGDGAGNFLPNGKVNGYQVLAVMLRALGYDKEGEFQGAGWEVRTARKAKELGITTTVTEGTLGAPATRALVAELVYRSIAQASTVNYVKLLGYVKTGATLAYEVFGLVGDPEVDIEAAAEGVNTILEYGDYAIYTPDMYEAMTTRYPAAPDGKYGEPVAVWFSPEVVGGVIPVRFNPVATYTAGLSESALYSLLQPVYDPYKVYKKFDIDFAFVDGVEDEAAANLYSRALVNEGTGKGAVVDVYCLNEDANEDGIPDSYVIAKRTYADWVAVPYNAKTNVPVVLWNNVQTKIDYPSPAYYSAHAGLAAYSLVLFNMYGDTIDWTTLHTATTKIVTLTNSYRPDEEDVHNSYIKVGKTTYEYDCNYLNNEMPAPDHCGDAVILDRDELEEVNYTQAVYFDDYGYMIYACNVPQYNAQGYMLVTNATYGGYSNDNGYYMNIKGYGLDGKTVTVKGGFGTHVYGTKTDAQDYEGVIGIYYYQVDTESGLYMLTEAPVVDPVAADDIKASDPCMGDYIVYDGTVYVVAKYNKSGLITGYTVTTGFKNIDDMFDAEIEGVAGAEYTDYEMHVLDLDAYGTLEGDEWADFVFITGAKTKADTKHKLETWDEVFFLLDTTPEKQFAEYDLYNVVLNGKVTTLKVDATAEWTFDDIGFYTVVAETNDYASDFDTVEMAEIFALTTDIFAYDGAVWEYAACQDGAIVLADNVKIVDVTTCEQVAAADLIIDPELGYNALYWVEVYGVAAEYNQYGEVTVLYVIGF